MNPPEIGKAGRIHSVAPFWGRTQRLSGSPDVILKEPSLGEGAADLGQFVAVKSTLPKSADKRGGRLGTHPPFQGANRLTVKVNRWHGAEYSRYTAGGG